MGRNIDWEKIIGDYNGFEKLAVQFIMSKYKNTTWKQTSKTRDGNADAIAIVMGYQAAENQAVQWWMEAKYSTSFKRLTRYRIDSTVVSAIHDGTVERVVFVTNIEIDAKTISDITETLRCSSQCQEVEFFTKYSLEYWLLTHPDIYDRFFENEDGLKPILLDDFIVSQEITYYDAASNLMIFKEPKRELFIGKEYIAYIGIVASRNIQNLSINVSNNLKGVRFLSKVKQISFLQGENIVQFRFVLKENFGYKNKKNKSLPMPVFQIDSVKLQPCQQITVLPHGSTMLKLAAQDTILKKIKKSYTDYIKKSQPQIVTLEGAADVGKSMVLVKFLSECSTNKYVVFYREFTESVKENAQILIYMLIYVLFPYVPPETIDETYINNINIAHIKKMLLNFLGQKDDCENIISYIAGLLKMPVLLPNGMSISRRIIVLDNIHRLDDKCAFFVSKVVNEIYEKNLPVYFIICGQPDFFYHSSYKYMVECCATIPLKLNLEINDILSNCDIVSSEKYNLKGLSFGEINATSLFLFQKYLLNENKKIKDMQDLIISLRLFWRSNIIERHILKCFKEALLQGKIYRVILDKIYWSCQPINFSEISEYETELGVLLKDSLIKYNPNDEILPANSIYQMYYRRHFLPEIQNLEYMPGSPEDLRIKYLSSKNKEILMECIKATKKLFSDHYYFKLEYILTDVFNTDTKIVLRNILDEYEYYNLYYMYAYAIHQNGELQRCKSIFESIHEEKKNSPYEEFLLLSLKCLWESGVISYENLEYENVINKKKEAEILIEKINYIKHEDIQACQYINYHDFRVLETLIYKELNVRDDLYYDYLEDMESVDFHYRALSFSARYALTLCSTDITLCAKILLDTGKKLLEEYGKNDKHYLWCMFYYYFYKMIFEKDHSLFKNVQKYHEKMRSNQYGNYRKKLYAMASYFYSIGDILTGNSYLFMDTLFPYESRNRYQVFYYETLALYESLNNNYDDAIQYLNKAISYIGTAQNYSIIPLHNKKLLEAKKFSSSRIKFFINEIMDLSIYYIDPRSAW